MTRESHLLEEFVEKKPQKGKLFDVLIASSVLYIISVIVFFSLDSRQYSFKAFDWQVLFAILILPSLGVIFLINNKRIGWIINSFYFLLITLVLLYSFFYTVADEKTISMERVWRGWLIIGLTLVSTVVLFSKPIRSYFRVSLGLFITVASISVGLAVLAAFAMSKS